MRGFGALLVGAIAVGCSSGSPATPDAVDAGQACGPPPGRYVEGRDPPAYCVKEVSGKLAAAQVLPKTSVSVCGLACFLGSVEADGRFVVPVNAQLPDNGYVLFIHGRPRSASLLVRLPTAPRDRIDLGGIELPPLPDPGVALPIDEAPASEVNVGPLTLLVAGGTSWSLALEDSADDVEGRLVRVAPVDVGRAPPFAAGASLVYALSPFQAKASKPFGVRIATSGGLAAKTPVDLVVMQRLGLGNDNMGGLPETVAKGHVSEDGSRIESDPGEGLTELTWIAVRPR